MQISHKGIRQGSPPTQPFRYTVAEQKCRTEKNLTALHNASDSATQECDHDADLHKCLQTKSKEEHSSEFG